MRGGVVRHPLPRPFHGGPRAGQCLRLRRHGRAQLAFAGPRGLPGSWVGAESGSTKAPVEGEPPAARCGWSCLCENKL